MANTSAYWDGARWTGQVAPSAPGPTSKQSETKKVDPTFAWLLAATPLLGLLINTDDEDLLGVISLGFIALNGTAMAGDRWRLAQAGRRTPNGLSFFFVPWYLVERVVVSKQSPAPSVVWALAFVVPILYYVSQAAGYDAVELDGPSIEDAIKADLIKMGSDPSITVDCPLTVPGSPGDVTTCVGRERGVSADIAVTVGNDATYTWMVVG